MNFNKIIIAGNITNDPELRALTSGKSVVNFTVATNRYYTKSDGTKEEEANFHNVVFFGKTADNIKKYMSKGSQILVEGRLQTRSWEDDNGEKHYRTEILGEKAQFGNAPEKKKREEETEEEGERVPDLDDIPFE